MLHQLPLYVSLVFGATTLATVWLFYRASRQSILVLVVLLAWMALQAGLSLAGFYRQTDAMPPRFPALVIPPLLVLIGLLRTAGGRRFLDSLRLDQLTLLHTVRIPVELVLFWLFVAGAVPKEMTFEGRNVDIVSGLTAPVVYYLAFVRKRLSGRGLLIWNLICLGLLVNIVLTAAMAVPSPVQQIAFSQPNIAILYFPFVWLPSVVVPIVLVAHVSSLRQLRRKASEKQTDLFTH
ncbi:hypothetical protein [Spirosoma sordidisoli]|uniref:Uncharacterized protein n=1 Tax=Spirosoma sordidisoli TaxID=2502893 RepID=A0A4Q2UMC2_9BACT|nr:hypothetical protein [Spirosoma sordidisoli]RYC70777.1 hypothetical protein EQG79_01085 [Spirosoma sordidisoli]